MTLKYIILVIYYTTACIYKRLTGKDNLMNVAVKAANFLENISGSSKDGEVKTAVLSFPLHGT